MAKLRLGTTFHRMIPLGSILMKMFVEERGFAEPWSHRSPSQESFVVNSERAQGTRLPRCSPIQLGIDRELGLEELLQFSLLSEEIFVMLMRRQIN